VYRSERAKALLLATRSICPVVLSGSGVSMNRVNDATFHQRRVQGRHHEWKPALHWIRTSLITTLCSNTLAGGIDDDDDGGVGPV
jgi:hypothetical protein